MKKALIVLVIGIFLMAPGRELLSKSQRRGAEVMVQNKGGTILRGELLTVRQGKLILLDSVSAKEVSIDIQDVDVVRIVKNPQLLKKAAKGFLYAGAPIAVLGAFSKMGLGHRAATIGIFGGIGALYGGFRELSKQTSETVAMSGLSQKRTDFVLNKLRSQSLFPNGLPENFDEIKGSMKTMVSRPAKAGKEISSLLPGPKFSRVHISFEPAYLSSRATKTYPRLFKDMGFADTRPGGSIFGFEYGPMDYPRVTYGPDISVRGAKVEYSLGRNFAVGFEYSSLAKGKVEGYKKIDVMWRGEQYYSEMYISESHKSEAFFLSAAWMPIPETFFNRSAVKLGAAIGLSTARITYTTSEYGLADENSKSQNVSKTVPAFCLFGEYDYYLARNCSLGAYVKYRYAPLKVGAFDLAGSYLNLDEQLNIIHSPMTVSFPAHRIDLGGPAAGVSVALHF